MKSETVKPVVTMRNMTKLYKVSITDEDGTLLDHITMRVDKRWRYFGLKPMEDESSDPRIEFVLIVGDQPTPTP